MSRGVLVSEISFCIMVLWAVLSSVQIADAASHSSHAPIRIDGNSQFTMANGVVGGDGTPASPYNISGWDINGMDATDGIGIRITNTAAHFIITDVAIITGSGIWMSNVSNGSVRLASFGYGSGIDLQSCVDMDLSGNYMNEGMVYSVSSSRLNISENDMYGIQLEGCSEVSAKDNTLDGIWLHDSINCTIIENTITTYGIGITGTSIEAFRSHKITSDNLLGGNPIRYFKDLMDPEFANPLIVGQLIVVNCTGASVHSLSIPETYFPVTLAFDERTTISNMTLVVTTGGSSQGITVIHSNNTVLENNSVSGAQVGGIAIQSSTHTLAVHNNIADNGLVGFGAWDSADLAVMHSELSGLWLEGVENATVDDNIVSGIYQGVIINSCTKLAISNNSIHADHWYGVGVSSSTDVNLYNNSVLGSWTKSGMWEYRLDQGVDIYSCNHVNVTGNRLVPAYPDTVSFDGGVRIRLSENVSVEGNNLFWSYYTALEISQCTWANVTGNHIVSNGVTDFYITGFLLSEVSHARVLANDVTGIGCGIVVDKSSEVRIEGNNASSNQYSGVRVTASSNSTVSDNNLSANGGAGLELDSSQNCSAVRNRFESNNYGVWVYHCENISIHHNEFLNNLNQAYDDSVPSNLWDDGYPSGGNYWSDYAGVDLFSGPAQDLGGSDGIGDTPYVFTGGQDRYPLMRTPAPSHVPVARFEVLPASGDATTSFTFDASATTDPLDPTGTLMFRWDFDGDGIWDTDWSHDMTATHQYSSPGEYDAFLEVKDPSGYTNKTQVHITVQDTAIPEFNSVTLVALTTICGFVYLTRVVSRQRKG